MKLAVIGTIILGFVLFALSSLWTTLFPPTNSWTPEKADRLSEIRERLNELGFMLQRASANRMHSGTDLGPVKAEYDSLNKEFDELKVEFETAAERPNTVSTVLEWTGISLAIVGIIGWYAVKQISG
jgi:preprotein translocase subunit Sss1